MNQLQRDQLGIKLTEIAMLYGKDFPKETAKIYINSLLSFLPDSFENYMKALSDYVSDKKNKFFPAPVHLREYLNPTINDDQLAVSAASRVIEAVSKFGWSNPGEAHAFIGDLGWRSVKVFGGWQYVCENLGTEINLSTFNAQIREISKATIQQAKLGIMEGPIGIPYKDPDALLNDKKREQILEFTKNLKTIEG